MPLKSTAEDFLPLSKEEFLNHGTKRQKIYSSASFESDMTVIGEGTYGKVYKARVKPSQTQSFEQNKSEVNDEQVVQYKALKRLKLH